MGFCWTKRTSRSAGGRTVSDAEIYALGVSPAWQGRGIGSALLADALAHPGDADRFSLYVDAANRRALGLYQRAGFEIADTDVLWGT